MWLYVLTAVGCYAFGAATACWLGWRFKRRLSKRLAGVQATLERIRELENRRVGTELGREHLVRASAGRPAAIGDGFATRPGSLARQARDEGPSNR